MTLQTRQIGRYLVIADTVRALRFLTDEWPGEQTDERQAAELICREVLEGKEPPELARLALVHAAKASGVFIADDPRPRR
ncbi:DUF982 domain-containing protein [Agaricicola taiwanensis]|uniref:DUF982 domain-containing protein n=1 Tax=Agaricicola taiwanensis TaxID=591372 RepID=UPI00166EFDD2|nr:DUF982 domain-containing protein [Agaricicola taiwanensis]